MTPSERLIALRAAYPPAMTPAQIGALLNLEAWEFRHEGMRLLGKAAGHSVPQPLTGTPISSDYLVHLPTQTGHDALTGRDDGTTAVVAFTWGRGPEDLSGYLARGERTIVDPVDPALTAVPVPPDLPGSPESPPAPVPVDHAAALAHLDAETAALFALHDEVARQIGSLNQQAQRLDARLHALEARPVKLPAPLPPSRPSWWPF